MKKTTTLIMLLTVIFAYSVQGQQIQANMYYSGEMDGWTATSMEYRLLGVPNWKTTILSDGNDGTSEFKFRNSSANWLQQWSSESTTSVSLGVKDDFWNPNNTTDGNFAESDTKYYTFTIKDVFNSTHSEGFVMETSAYPVSITSVSEPTGNVSSNSYIAGVDIEVETSTAKSPEERFYVRYTEDYWITSSVALVSFNGTSGIATIPVHPADTTIQYYVFSTTVSNPAADFDLMTIEFDNNGGTNYSYTTLPGTAQDGDWHSASTWTEGVPATDDNVIISHDVTVNTSAVEINNIIINDTASLEFSGGYNHIIHGSIIVNGDAIISNNSQINIEGLIISPNN